MCRGAVGLPESLAGARELSVYCLDSVGQRQGAGGLPGVGMGEGAGVHQSVPRSCGLVGARERVGSWRSPGQQSWRDPFSSWILLATVGKWAAMGTAPC